jgi:hypothetical protein
MVGKRVERVYTGTIIYLFQVVAWLPHVQHIAEIAHHSVDMAVFLALRDGRLKSESLATCVRIGSRNQERCSIHVAPLLLTDHIIIVRALVHSIL